MTGLSCTNLHHKSVIEHPHHPSMTPWARQFSPGSHSAAFCLYVAVHSLSHVLLFVTPWTAARQASLALTISQSSPKFMSIELVMPSNQLILCCPLLLLLSVLPSIRGFSKELTLYVRRAKFWTFSFSISPSNEYSGLIPFKMDWFDLLALSRICSSTTIHKNISSSVFALPFLDISCKSSHQCVVSYEWVLSLSIMFLRSIHDMR